MIHGSTDHSGDVTGSEHVFGVQREKHSCHAEEDEVAEGDVHCCLATPVSRWHQTRDSQSRAALNLSKKKKKKEIREISKTGQALWHPQYTGN